MWYGTYEKLSYQLLDDLVLLILTYRIPLRRVNHVDSIVALSRPESVELSANGFPIFPTLTLADLSLTPATLYVSTPWEYFQTLRLL
jgi:hypothetical protein